MTTAPKDSEPYQLFADEFVREDVGELIHFNCGNEPWAKAATEWIIASDVWESIRKHGTKVWLFRNVTGVIVGFGSLGITRRKWPPPDGGYCNFLFVPMLGLDVHFHGQPGRLLRGHVAHCPATPVNRLEFGVKSNRTPKHGHRDTPLMLSGHISGTMVAGVLTLKKIRSLIRS